MSDTHKQQRTWKVYHDLKERDEHPLRSEKNNERLAFMQAGVRHGNNRKFHAMMKMVKSNKVRLQGKSAFREEVNEVIHQSGGRI